jgi:hypothetical protein
MSKVLLHTFILLIICQAVFSQIPPDTLRVRRDSISNLPTDTLPFLSDTIQYNDTSIKKTASGKDTVVFKKKVHLPRRATIRSLIIPGWGQVYNKKYWKVPIVYAAIGFPAYLFDYNRKWYNRTKYALSIVANNRYTGTTAEDSLKRVHPDLKIFVDGHDQGSLINYRNEFRRDMDYAILFTILMWGLNVVDATVDAHLKGFDVGDELSIRIKPSMLQNSMGPGISLVINFK